MSSPEILFRLLFHNCLLQAGPPHSLGSQRQKYVGKPSHSGHYVCRQFHLERLRGKLEGLAQEIVQYLRGSEDSAAAVEPDKGLGRLSRMEAMQDQQLVLEMRRRKKRQKLEVQNALEQKLLELFMQEV